MALIIGMFDEILNIDALLQPLVEDDQFDTEHVTFLVRKESLDYAKTRTKLFKDRLHAPDEDFVQVLTGKGIPDAQARLYSNGVEAGKEVVIVQTGSETSRQVNAYLQQGERRPLHATPPGHETRPDAVESTQMSNDIIDARDDTKRATVDMVEEEAVAKHRDERWEKNKLQ